MNTKTYLFALIASGLCFVTTGATSLLEAQTSQTAKTPLSFDGLGADQSIRFFVNTKHAHFGAAFLCFEVEVSGQPQPEAKIRLLINASMVVPKIEKEWGHHVGEQVTRSLTSADLQTLEKFLTTYRAKGALPPPALSGQPATAFERVTYRTNQEGNRYADTDRKEFYPVSEEAERDFVKNFIGYSEPDSN